MSKEKKVFITSDHQENTEQQSKNSSLTICVIALISAVIIVGFSYFLTLIPNNGSLNSDMQNLSFLMMFVAFVLGILAWIMFTKHQKFRKKSVLGPVILLTKYLPEKNAIAFNLKLKPNESFMLKKLDGKLMLKERTESGSGTTQTSNEAQRNFAVTNLSSNEQINANELHEFTGEFMLPNDLTLSVTTANNSLNWSLVFRLKADKTDYTVNKAFWVNAK